MNHSFDTDLAAQYGIEEAILIQHLQFWIVKNRANGENFIDGRTWTYSKLAAMALIFPYMNERKIRHALGLLEEKGVIIKGMHGGAGDRTLWIAFVDEVLMLPPVDNPATNLSHRAKASAKNGAGSDNNVGGSAKNGAALYKKDVNKGVNEDDPDGAAQPAAARSGKGTRLDPEWKLPKSWGEWALARYPHWTAEHVRDTVAVLFRNHWCAKTGRDATKLDWKGTWENWCIKQEEISPFKNPAMPHASGATAGQWWTSTKGIEGKGAELGVLQAENEIFPEYRKRVLAAAGDGPWIDQFASSTGIRSHNAPAAPQGTPGVEVKGDLKSFLKSLPAAPQGGQQPGVEAA